MKRIPHPPDPLVQTPHHLPPPHPPHLLPVRVPQHLHLLEYLLLLLALPHANHLFPAVDVGAPDYRVSVGPGRDVDVDLGVGLREGEKEGGAEEGAGESVSEELVGGW